MKNFFAGVLCTLITALLSMSIFGDKTFSPNELALRDQHLIDSTQIATRLDETKNGLRGYKVISYDSLVGYDGVPGQNPSLSFGGIAVNCDSIDECDTIKFVSSVAPIIGHYARFQPRTGEMEWKAVWEMTKQ